MRRRRLTTVDRRTLSETDRGELVANAIGKMIDAADLTSMTIQKLLLACLVCEMKNANTQSIRETFPHEQISASVVLSQAERVIDPPFNTPRKTH